MTWKQILACFVCMAILISLLGTLFALQFTFLPVRTPGKNVLVHIQPGQSVAHIASMLKEKEVIKNPLLFQILARSLGLSSKLQAGEFEIDTSWNRLKILRTLASGSHVLHSLRIPEGLAWWQTAQVVADSGLSSFESFQKAVHNQKLLDEFGIPADSAEGYLFPETYNLPRPHGNRAEPIVRLMIRQFYNTVSTSLWPDKLPNPQEIHNLVILASLVEKETAQPQERRKVAGVFVNRLQRGMRLQCDPTVIYGLGGDFAGNLTKKQLRDADNIFNTYTHAGLPPGPICSPGLASLQAAQDPEDHEYLYFVSQGDGSHYFSRSLKEHNRAVRRYLLP